MFPTDYPQSAQLLMYKRDVPVEESHYTRKRSGFAPPATFGRNETRQARTRLLVGMKLGTWTSHLRRHWPVLRLIQPYASNDEAR